MAQPQNQPQPVDINQVHKQRYQVLEQYADLRNQIEVYEATIPKLRVQAEAKFEEIRYLTQVVKEEDAKQAQIQQQAQEAIQKAQANQPPIELAEPASPSVEDVKHATKKAPFANNSNAAVKN